MAYVINDNCVACGSCISECPVEAVGELACPFKLQILIHHDGPCGDGADAEDENYSLPYGVTGVEGIKSGFRGAHCADNAG